MKCPRCSSMLSPVDDDGVQVEVCTGCKGEWLSAGELQLLVEHHAEVFTPEELASVDAINKVAFTAENCDHDELNCPQCETVPMEHFNYGDTSGMILHKCPECGGIWTDKDQLKKAEMLVDGWKECLNQDVDKYGPILEKVARQEQEELDKAVSISRFGFVNAILRRFCEE
jgi:Zn-finger nucleic acid-binding protein